MDSKWKCWCGHQNTAHSPFGETEYMVGVGKKELTSCKWCDKAIANRNKKEASESHIKLTKAEENAWLTVGDGPHPLAKEKPVWLRNQKLKELLKWADLKSLEMEAQKLTMAVVMGGDTPNEREIRDAVTDLENVIADIKTQFYTKSWAHERV